KEALERFPKVNKELVSMAIYYDAAMPSPERIAIEVLKDGQESNPNAVAFNYMSAVGATKDSVELRDELTGETYQVEADLVINAAGPWIDFVNDAMGEPSNFIGGTKGSHIVLDNPELFEALNGNEFFFENEDGRIVLVFPVLDRVIVGTSDIRIDHPDDAVCTDEEVDYFIDLIDNIFPTIPVDPSQIVFRFSGVRPLPAADAKTTGQISRDHSNRIIEPSEKYQFPIFNLIGGKWTTFRAFSEQVSNAALKRLKGARKASTANLPIGGGADFPDTDEKRNVFIDEVVRKTEIDPQMVAAWLDRYGTGAAQIAKYISAEYPDDKPLADRPDYSTGEIAYLTEKEGAQHIDDILLRRTVLAIMGYTTPNVIADIADTMSGLLNWTAEQKAAEIDRVNQLLFKKHKVELV
ncbi:MAG: glycerol-3-phosphate dehydrogenase/oxidase, partial [Chloroflexota bacterium]